MQRETHPSAKWLTAKRVKTFQLYRPRPIEGARRSVHSVPKITPTQVHADRHVRRESLDRILRSPASKRGFGMSACTTHRSWYCLQTLTLCALMYVLRRVSASTLASRIPASILWTTRVRASANAKKTGFMRGGRRTTRFSEQKNDRSGESIWTLPA